MPFSGPSRSYRSTSAAKSLCIVDTCSLVYMAHVQLVRKPLRDWLWEEFDVKYSEAVSEEYQPFKVNSGTPRRWEKGIWRVANLQNYEQAIFSSHQRQMEDIYCSRCKQRTMKYEMFTPDLTEKKDRGERHNCCLALYAVREGRSSQIIFLTDDLKARRDYTIYFFHVFPIGVVWSLLDLITYLFLRYWREIPLQSVKDALRDANSLPNGQAGTSDEGQRNGFAQYKESEKKTRRLQIYYTKVEQINQIFSRI